MSEFNTPSKTHESPASGEMESSLGISVKPPAFQLMAGPPIQRHVPHRFTGSRLADLHASDLEDPSVIAEIEGLRGMLLSDLAMIARDPAVRDYVLGVIARRDAAYAAAHPPPPTPLHGRTTNPEPNVLTHQRPMFEQLRDYLVGLLPRIRTLVANPPAGYANLQNNPNVEDSIQRLQNVITAFQAESIMVRFDPSLGGGMTQAAYSFTINMIRIRPFDNAGEMARLVPNLVHEQTHADQDRAMEERMAGSTSPVALTADEEVDREVEGRRTGVYMSRIMQALGEMPDTPGGRADTASDNLFFDDFERARTARGRRRREAERDIRTTIASGYASQITRNTPSAFVRAELGTDNHVVLYLASGQRDVGQVPDTMTNLPDLNNHVEGLIRALPDYNSLFDGAGGTRLVHLNLILFSQGRRLSERVLTPPAASTSTVTTGP